MNVSKALMALALMGLSGYAVAEIKNPYDCQSEPQLCQAYVQGIVDSLTQLKEQADMQDAFSHRALSTRSGQRYQWALDKYCDRDTYHHWVDWSNEQQLLPEQQQWLTSQLKTLNGCQ